MPPIDYVNGTFFEVEVPGLEIGVGSHEHVFSFSDGLCGSNVRYPPAGEDELPGPIVDSAEPNLQVTEPNGEGDFIDIGGPDLTFEIEWTATDLDDDSLLCSIYWDSDNVYDNGGLVLIDQLSYPVGAGSYSWDMTGLGEGIYYVYMDVDDGYGNHDTDYSNGAIMLADEPYCDDTWSVFETPLYYGILYPKGFIDVNYIFHVFGGNLSTNTIDHVTSSDLLSWSAIDPVSVDVQPDPKFDVCQRGSIIDLVYVKYLTSYEIFHKRSYDYGQTWGVEHAITSDDGVWSKYPAVAHASDGVIHVVWVDAADGGEPRVYSTQSSDEGVSWSSPHLLSGSTPVVQYRSNPVMVVEGDYVHLAYAHPDEQRVEYRKQLNSSGWGAPYILASTNDNIRRADISIYGNYVDVVWENTFDSSTYYSYSGTAGTSFSQPVGITYDGLYRHPRVVRNSSGVYNVKLGGSSSGPLSYAKSTDNGATWCSPYSILGTNNYAWHSASANEDYVFLVSGNTDTGWLSVYTIPAYTGYELIPGIITVDVSPDSLDAPWILEGGSAGVYIESSGDTVMADMEYGEYTMTWGSVPDWYTPLTNPETKQLPPGGEIEFEGAYISHSSPIVNPDGTGIFATIQAAIGAVEEPAEIILSDGVFAGDGNRDLDFHGKAITVRSRSGNPESCVIDCGGSPSETHRGFYFHSGEDTNSVLMGITVTGGYVAQTSHIPENTGGGILCLAGASPKIVDCMIVDNTVQFNGGGISAYESSPVFYNCTVAGNSAANSCGGFWASGGAPQFYGCTFEFNQTDNNGGGGGCDGDLIFTQCVFRGNTANTNGGGLNLYDTSDAVIDQCVFVDNNAGNSGGAINCWVVCSPHITRCTLVRNSAGSTGAGICSQIGSWPILENSIIAFSVDMEAISCLSDGGITISSSDLFGNTGGNWIDCVASQYGTNGNIEEDPLFCDEGLDNFYLDAGSPCSEDNNPIYGQYGAYPVGCGLTAIPEEVVSQTGPTLYPCIPNPFNPTTSIKYDLPNQAHVSLRIFDISGRLISVLVSGRTEEAGAHEAIWNGQDETGRIVAAGVYFYRLQAGGDIQTKRMTLVK